LNKTIEHLKLNEMIKVSKNLSDIYSLLITDGEPILRKELIQIIKVFVENNNVKKITINTNGLLPEKLNDTVKIILETLPVQLSISINLDGLPKTHDELRNTKGAFLKVSKCVDYLKKIRISYPVLNYYIVTTVNNRNLKELEELSKYVDKFFGCLHLFELIRSPSKSCLPENYRNEFNPRDEELLIDDNKLNEVFSIIFNIIRSRSIGSWQNALRQASILTGVEYAIRSVKNKKLKFKCQAGFKIGGIYPAGEVFLCELMKSEDNLRDINYRFEEIWKSKKSDNMRKIIKQCCCSNSCFK